MIARFRTRNGKAVTLNDVRFDEKVVTGTTRHGQRLTLRRKDLVQQVLLKDDPPSRWRA